MELADSVRGALGECSRTLVLRPAAPGDKHVRPFISRA